MADVSSIIGIVLMIIGGIFVLSGLVLCYTTKGEYYNQDEVQAMVAAEMLEAEKKKKAEAEAAEMAMREEMMDEQELAVGAEEGTTQAANLPKKKRRGPLIAS